ncbi:MAG: glycosyltransferase [Candidatus Nanoarchaeia archaeon]|nr:glycosyltransferase [Candidatus Nanoarchaeia archaeon]
MIIDYIIIISSILVSAITVGFFLISVIYWNKKIPKTKKEPFVSVVIASMNEEATIKKHIESLLNQSYKKYELIYIDESKDKTRSVLKNFASKHRKIKLILLNGKRHGKRKCLEIGIKKARGEIILYTDADCYATKNWIKNMVNGLNSYDVVISSAKTKIRRFVDEIKNLEHIYWTGILPTIGLFIKTKFIGGWGGNMGFWKKDFRKIKGYYGIENYIAEDIALVNKFRKNKYKIGFIFNAIIWMEPEEKWLKQKIRWIRITRQAVGKSTAVFYFYPMMFNSLFALGFSLAGLFFNSLFWWMPITVLFVSEALCAAHIYFAIKQSKKSWLALIISASDFLIKFIYFYAFFKRSVYWKGQIKVQ